MISRALSFLTGWKARLLALGGALALFAAMLAKVYLAGKAAERQSIDRNALDAMRKRKEVDDDVAAMDHADLDERYLKYLRDGE